jgi:CRP-like cAMP-binding protein
VISWFQAFAFKFNLYHYGEENKIIQEVGAGEFIGEVALVLDEDTHRTASVVATSEAGLYKLNRVDP